MHNWNIIGIVSLGHLTLDLYLGSLNFHKQEKALQTWSTPNNKYLLPKKHTGLFLYPIGQSQKYW